jgi:hypothetical protein
MSCFKLSELYSPFLYSSGTVIGICERKLFEQGGLALAILQSKNWLGAWGAAVKPLAGGAAPTSTKAIEMKKGRHGSNKAESR